MSSTPTRDKHSCRKMLREFHPVGQGAFYTETFLLGSGEYHTVVYDCGVSGNAAPLVAQLDALKKTYGEIIDIVFISHFHADHISHIPKLLKDFYVKAIVLPDVTPAVAVDAFLNNYVESEPGDDFANNHLIDSLLSNELKIGRTKVIRVDQLKDEEGVTIGNNTFLDLDKDIVEHRSDSSSIPSDTIIRLFGWEYILCNYPCAHTSALIVEMRQIYPELLDALLQQKWAEARVLLDEIPFDDIAKLYKNCFPNNENEESMTVLSRPIKDGFPPSTCCLYTGDSPFIVEKRLKYVKQYYSNHWDKIGTLQSPHHGADKDNPECLHDKSRTSIVCCATKNQYGHPGQEALVNMAQAKCVIRLVTEKETSAFEKYIHY